VSTPDRLPDEAIALVLKRLSSKVAENLKFTKAAFESGYEAGEKHTFRSPLDGKKLGSVYRTDPDGEWIVSNRNALEEHLMGFEGNRVCSVGIREDAPYEEILAVLNEHAPQYLEDRVELHPDAVQAALDQSAATGEAAAPGITFLKPGGVVTVRPDKEVDAAIQGLIQGGLLTWDGQRALPAAEERKAS
jgi:hypothetical protein